jgi:excisionase family DNA binding protein
MSPSEQMQNAVDVAQASELTGLSKKAIRRRLERGTLNSIKVGGRRKIPVSELVQHGLLETTEASAGSPVAETVTQPAGEPAAQQTAPVPPPTAPTPASPQAAPQAAVPEPSPAAPETVAAAQPPAAPQPPVASQPPDATQASAAAQAPTPPLVAAEPQTVAPPQAATQAVPEAANGQVATPPERGAPAYPPGQPVPMQGDPALYPPRGTSYYWYKYPALRWLAVIVAIAVVALLVWLLAIRSDGSEPTAVIQPGGGPVGATEADLVSLSQELGQPVYWAGPMAGTRLEITQSSNSFAYLRYLTENSPVGDPSPDFLTVGTYPALDAFSNLRSYAKRSQADTTRIQNGGFAVTVPGSPTSVYFAYPHEDVQVEVYDPEPRRALDLVKSGVVRPVTNTPVASATTPTTTTLPSTTPTTPEGTPPVAPQG